MVNVVIFVAVFIVIVVLVHRMQLKILRFAVAVVVFVLMDEVFWDLRYGCNYGLCSEFNEYFSFR